MCLNFLKSLSSPDAPSARSLPAASRSVIPVTYAANASAAASSLRVFPSGEKRFRSSASSFAVQMPARR